MKMTTISSSLPASAVATPVTVAKTSRAGLPQLAATLAADASVIATLGGAAVAGATYSAAGLLNSIAQAGAPSDAGSAAAPATQTSSADAATTATDSGLYSAAGVFAAPMTDVSSNFASILKTNPGMAASVISDSFNQGIVGTFSTSA